MGIYIPESPGPYATYRRAARIALNMIYAPVLVVTFVLQLAASGHRLAETLRFIALHSFAGQNCP